MTKKVIHAEEVIEKIVGLSREEAENILVELWPEYVILGMDDMFPQQFVEMRMIIRVNEEGIVEEAVEG